MTICPMTRADIPALVALERACFAHPWSQEAFLEELDNPLARFLVAQNGVGYVGCHVVCGEGFITNVAVDPLHRRQGIADALLASLEQTARQEGVTALHLEVRESNTAAQHLYEKNGYIVDGKRKGFYDSPREDAVLMTKTLEV